MLRDERPIDWPYKPGNNISGEIKQPVTFVLLRFEFNSHFWRTDSYKIEKVLE